VVVVVVVVVVAAAAMVVISTAVMTISSKDNQQDRRLKTSFSFGSGRLRGLKWNALSSLTLGRPICRGASC
jgi:hypothetical protein